MATDDDMSFLLGVEEVANDSVVLSTQQDESIQVEQGLTVLPEGELDTGVYRDWEQIGRAHV